jgi:hypothetical protein
MKALISIQHEVTKVHRQRQISGAVSKDDSGDVWSLLRYVDLVRPKHEVDAHDLAVWCLCV